MKKNKIILIVLIITIIMLTMGVTYAYLRKTLIQTNNSRVSTLDCLDMELTDEENEINLLNAYPIEDVEGMKQVPYSFSITNKCTTPVFVDINIDSLATSTLPINYVKLNYKNVSENYNYTSKISEYPVSVQKVISNSLANTNKQLDRVYLKGNNPEVDDVLEKSKKSFEIKLWIDKDTSWNDAHETVNNVEISKNYEGKITLIEMPTISFSPNWNAESGTLLAAIENGNYVFTSPSTTPGVSISNKYEREIGKTTDDYGTSYYFRGNIINNYVMFANKCWKIIRIDGNKNIKLWLWNNTDNCNTKNVPQSIFNTYTDNNAYVGFMYGNIESNNFATPEETGVHDNLNDSKILENLKNWYDTAFETNETTKYTNMLADVIWCGDKSLTSGTGLSKIKSTYGAYDRIILKKEPPSLTCKDAIKNDINNLSRYTAYKNTDVNNKNGNGKLKSVILNTDPIEYKYYKVGLLTADEVALVGFVFNESGQSPLSNSFSFLSSGSSSFWTMSPSYYNSEGAKGFDVWAYSFLHSNHVQHLNDLYYMHPAVSLIPTVTIEPGGDGTKDNPYVVIVPEPNQS